jgi:hypothetical protein
MSAQAATEMPNIAASHRRHGALIASLSTAGTVTSGTRSFLDEQCQ